jgi:hypothetical protein
MRYMIDPNYELRRPIFVRKPKFKSNPLLHGLISTTISWHCPFKTSSRISINDRVWVSEGSSKKLQFFQL